MSRVVRASLGIAAIGGAGVLVAALRDPARALLAWVAAYGFGLGTVLGALILVMVFHLTRAAWPLVFSPLLSGITRSTPLFALLFLPIALGMRSLYPWAHAQLGGDPVDAEVTAAIEHQRVWNNPTFFLVRAAFYLATWIALATLLRRAELDPTRQRRVSGAGLPILAFTLTFAAFDWFMALEPGWVVNMLGLYFFAGGLASAVSLLALLAWAASRRGPIDAPRAKPDHFHALGRLMLMATIFWAYIGFFQLMLVWIADLPREVSFYAERSRGPYRALDALLVLGHFVLPFLALLSRRLKRHAGLLAIVAAWLILMDAIDLTWLVLPSGNTTPHVLDVAPFLFIGGAALAYGARRLRPMSARVLVDSLEYRSP